MVIPKTIIDYFESQLKDNIEKLKTGVGPLNINAKTPQRVKNLEDFHFGVYIGSIKTRFMREIEDGIGTKMTDDEWDQIDNLIIDYQDDKLASHITLDSFVCDYKFKYR